MSVIALFIYAGIQVNSLWSSDAMWRWVNIGPGNGLLPDGTKPLPEPMLTYDEFGALAYSREQFHGNFSRYQFEKGERERERH